MFEYFLRVVSLCLNKAIRYSNMAGLQKFDGGGPATLTNKSRNFVCSLAREASGNLLFDGETILVGRPPHVGGRSIAVQPPK